MVNNTIQSDVSESPAVSVAPADVNPADTAILDHDSYTPAHLQAFDLDMANNFWHRYGEEIVRLADQYSSEYEYPATLELFTPDKLLTWNQGKPYLRGYSDNQLMAGYLDVVVPSSQTNRLVPIYVDFHSELVWLDASLLDHI